MTYSPEIQEIINKWCTYLNSLNDWRTLIKDIQPKQGGCGLIYEIPNPINAEYESFAIADMSYIGYSEPHYHSAHVTEIYFVLQGTGITIIGNKEYTFKPGDVLVTPPLTTHYVIPKGECVLAVVNTQVFDINDYHVITESNDQVAFDKNQFNQLVILK